WRRRRRRPAATSPAPSCRGWTGSPMRNRSAHCWGAGWRDGAGTENEDEATMNHHLLQRAQQALRDRNPALAAPLARQAEAQAPLDVEMLLQLGILFGQHGQLQEALAWFRRAVELAPALARAHNNLGVALAQAGRQEESLRELQEAVRLDPQYAEAHFNLGNIHGERKERDQAVACYRRALELKRDHAGALNNLGQLLRETAQPR